MTAIDDGSKYRAKYQIPVTYLSPNECIGCLKTQNDAPGMADLGRDIDWYGVPYICKDCAIEVASLFGAVSPIIYETLKREFELVTRERDELARDNSALRKIIDGYNSLSDSSRTLPQSSPSIPDAGYFNVLGEESGTSEPPEVAADATDGGEDERSGVPESVDGEQGSGDSETDESSDIEGPSDVRDDPGDKLAGLLKLQD